ncbi:MAG: hypothetical protein ABIP85_22970 [Chthoniobacteraceae bacterium]
MRSLTNAVNFLRRHRPTRALLAVLMLLGWVTATNHCALGLMQNSPLAKAEHAKCCSGKSAPAKNDQPPGGARECCKSIHAVPLPDAKGLVKYDGSHFAVHAFALLTVLGSEAVALDALATLHDHGPPRAESFAELVLQRSLPGNAPPFTA